MASLISKGHMHARIDSQSKIIHSRETNDRYNTIQKDLQLTNRHTKEIRRGLLRLSLLQNGLSVTSGDKTQLSQVHGVDDQYFDTNYSEDSHDMTVHEFRKKYYFQNNNVTFYMSIRLNLF